MEHLAEEGEQVGIVAAQDIEARIMEDPVVIPVVAVIHPVLPDVASCVREPRVGRRELRKVIEPPEKRRLLECTSPGHPLGADGVTQIASSATGNAHSSTLAAHSWDVLSHERGHVRRHSRAAGER